MNFRPVVFSVLLLCACGAVEEADLSGDVLADTSADESSALTTTELKVATTGITAWLKPYAVRETRGVREVFVLRGRASVNLENAFSWVPDDGFCETQMLTARTFETVCHFVQNGELNSLLSGLPLFVRLDQVGGKNAVLRFVLEPRFVDATGSSALWLNTAIKPIYVPEVGLTYRGKVRAPSAPTGTIGETKAAISKRATAGEYNVDVPYEALVQAASLSGARFAAGTAEKRTGIAFGITGLEIARTDDAYAHWPATTCTSTVQQCLNTAGASAKDYEACGSYREVSRCNVPSTVPQLGIAPDDRSKIDAVVATLGPVSVTNYYVQAVGSARPSLEQVVRAWQRQDPLGATFVSDQTAAQLGVALDAFGARALVPAIQQTVLQQAFKAQRFTTGTEVYEVLYFTAAARFVVIRLPGI